MRTIYSISFIVCIMLYCSCNNQNERNGSDAAASLIISDKNDNKSGSEKTEIAKEESHSTIINTLLQVFDDSPSTLEKNLSGIFYRQIPQHSATPSIKVFKAKHDTSIIITKVMGSLPGRQFVTYTFHTKHLLEPLHKQAYALGFVAGKSRLADKDTEVLVNGDKEIHFISRKDSYTILVKKSN